MPQTKLYNYTVDYLDNQEYHSLKNEIFNSDIYHFETENPEPVIIDAGAHIGLATLYFKRLYPNAHIIAIEPNPAAFDLLETNIWQNDLKNTKAINIALDAQKKEVTLHQDPDQVWLSSTSIHQGAWNGEQQTEALIVPAMPLSDFLGQPVDLLKMDIEGAEIKVLTDAGDKLKQVDQLIVECHGTEFSTLSKFQKFLENLGFTVSFAKDNKQINIQQAKGLFFLNAHQ